MSSRRKRFTEEFKREAVRLVEETGRSASQVARELGITPSALCRWRKQFEEERDAGLAPGSKKAMEEELRRLRRENEQLREEREILKKAAAFFAKQDR